MADNDLSPVFEEIESNRTNKIPTPVRFDRIPEEHHSAIIDAISEGYDPQFKAALVEASKAKRRKVVRFDIMPDRKQAQEQSKMQEMLAAAKQMIGKVGSGLESAAQGMATGTNVNAQAMQQSSAQLAPAMGKTVQAVAEAPSKILQSGIEGGAVEAAKAVPAGIASGASFGLAGGEGPESNWGQAGHVAGQLIGSVPAFMYSEAAAGAVLTKEAMALSMAKTTPLSRTILKETLSGTVFGAQEQLATGETDPLKAGSEAASAGVMFAGFAGVLGAIAKRVKGDPNKVKNTIIPITEEVERLRFSEASFVNPTQVGGGEKPIPSVHLADELDHIKNLVQKGIINPDQLKKIENPELSLSYPQNRYMEFSNIIDAAVKHKAKIEDVIVDAEKSRYRVRFTPEKGYEQTADDVGEIGFNLSEQMLGTLEPDARIVKAGKSFKDSPSDIADAIVSDLYQRELPDAIANKSEKALMERISKIRTEPKEWQRAVDEFASMYGYDAINFAEDGIKVINSDMVTVRTGDAVRSRLRSVIPDVIPDDALDLMPMIKDTLKNQPSAHQLKSKYWQAKKTNPNATPDELIGQVRDWARKQATLDPAKLIDLDVAKVGKALNAEQKDIGLVQNNFVDWTHVFDQIDPSGVLNRKIAFPFKKAETDATLWAYKVKGQFDKVMGNLKPGSEESALLQKAGELGEWTKAKQTHIENLIKAKDLKGASAAKVELAKEREKIAKFMTPERTQQLAKIRKTYDWLIDDVLNPTRGAVGKKPINKREDYFMHFQELTLMDEMFGGMAEIPDEFAVEKFFLKENEPFFSAELQRRGIHWKEDAVGGFHRYVEGISRVIFLTPQAQKANAAAEYLPPMLKNFVQNTTRFAIGKSPSGTPGSFDQMFKEISESTMGKMALKGQKNIISNSIVANWGTALAQLNVIPVLLPQVGVRNVLKAVVDIYGPQAAFRRGAARSLSPAVQSHSMSTFDLERGSVNSFKHIVNLPVEAADNEMSQLAFWAGINQAKEMGKRGQDIIIHADKVASFINATYTDSSAPQFMRSQAVKFMAPLQRQLLNGSATAAQQLGTGPWKDRLHNGALMYASGVGMNMIMRGVADSIGLEETREMFSPTDLIPFYSFFTYGGTPMVFKTVGQAASGVKGLVQGKEGAEWKTAKAGMMLGMPYGGRQLINLVEGKPFGRSKKEDKSK